MKLHQTQHLNERFERILNSLLTNFEPATSRLNKGCKALSQATKIQRSTAMKIEIEATTRGEAWKDK